MTTHDFLRQRITSWPGIRVDVPSTFFSPPYRIDHEFVWAGGGDDFHLPEDVHLFEVMDLDIESDDAVLEFMRTWGVPTVSLQGRAIEGGWRDLGLPIALSSCIPGSYAHLERLIAVEKAVAEYLHSVESDGSSQRWDSRDFIHVEEARIRLALLRDMTRVWACTTGAISTDELASSWESGWAQSRPLPMPDEYRVLDEAWWTLTGGYLNAALTPYHVRVELDIGGPVPESRLGAPYGTPYETMCLQLANDIAGRELYKRCANEACGRLFARQRGRSTTGIGRSTGVNYCSVQCNRATSQRKLRARQRTASELRERGLTVEQIAERLGASSRSVSRWLASQATRNEGAEE